MKIQKNSLCIGGFASSLLIASQSLADGYFGSASASLVHSDNGKKSSTDKIAEQQERYNLNLGASYENDVGKFEADYGASYRSFSENSQPNKSALEGHSSLQLGNQAQLAELLVEHSRQTLLNKADSLDLTANQDEREVIAVSPEFNWHVSSADLLFLKGNFSDIRYLENEQSNSTRTGATLGVLHRISEIDNIGLNLQSTKVDFEYFPASNYKLHTAALSYRTNLRQLTYRLDAGASQSETESDDKYTSPYYLASIDYHSGTNTLGLNIAQEITDTSFGGGNKGVSGGPNSGDGAIGQSSQINRKSAEIQWTITSICGRCTALLTARTTRDQYLYIDKNSSESSGGVTGIYLISNAARISVRFNRVERKFLDDLLGKNYSLNFTAIDYAYKFGKSLETKISITDEKRVDENASSGYREKQIGLSLSYSF